MKITSSPIPAAREIRNYLGWVNPHDYKIEEVALALGLYVKKARIDGAEGRLLINGKTGIITIKDNIKNLGKHNFVIAHEIGHFLLHKNKTALYEDTENTLSEWHNYENKLEQEANVFATELLMPSYLFISKIKGKKLSIDLIKDIASFFEVSLTACVLRYVNLGSFPSMVIFIEKGIIKWKRESIDFPFQFLPIHTEVPAYTVAGDFFNGNGIEENPEKVNVIDWFPEDYEAQKKKHWRIYEQCFQVSKDGIITFLWTF